MKVSYNWLQNYFKEKLPTPKELEELLSLHAFEVEEVTQVGGDSMIDVDVLPNRSSDSLSHRGIAKELSVLLNLPFKNDPLKNETKKWNDSKLLEVTVADPKLCRRYSAVVIEGVTVSTSPEWLQKFLETLGQKSINNIVDATNFVMFDIGQPLHAFDMDGLSQKNGKYNITVRVGKNGEKVTTLDGEEHTVGENNLLITDGNNENPIGIAGVKGGKTAGINEKTKNIIIESANFDPVSVRKTSQALKLWTDASIRFQNEPPQELPYYGIEEVVARIKEVAGGEVEGYVDVYSGKPESHTVSVSVSHVNALLGSSISEKEIEDIFKRFGFNYKKSGEVFSVTVPFERLDLRIPEDLIEEVGRVYGYKNISSQQLSPTEKKSEINKKFYYIEKVRQLLVQEGFSEVYTYSLQNDGEVELQNPLASDKAFLRKNLRDGLSNSLTSNLRNIDLLGLQSIKIFEIGTVFEKGGEHLALSIGIRNIKGLKQKQTEEEIVQKIANTLFNHLDVGRLSGTVHDGIFEIDFDTLVEKLLQPKGYDTNHTIYRMNSDIKYKPISPYPFVLRDIAVWVPKGKKESDVLSVIKKEAGDLLVQNTLFDTYEKDDKVSYAFRLVFQSGDMTLTDDEINVIMEKVANAINSKEGWEVR